MYDARTNLSQQVVTSVREAPGQEGFRDDHSALRPAGRSAQPRQGDHRLRSVGSGRAELPGTGAGISLAAKVMNKDMEPDALPPLPPFNYHGYLPEGVHDTTFEQLRARLVLSIRSGSALWERLQEFLRWAACDRLIFPCLHRRRVHHEQDAAGGHRRDFADARAVWCGGLCRDGAVFRQGDRHDLHEYSVHLHFWCEGFPGGLSDFRRFFQYLRPQDAAPLGLREGARKGIVRIKL